MLDLARACWWCHLHDTACRGILIARVQCGFYFAGQGSSISIVPARVVRWLLASRAAFPFRAAGVPVLAVPSTLIQVQTRLLTGIPC